MKEELGFDLLLGEEIIGIDESCINVVYLKMKSGKIIAIDAEQQHYGIGVLNCTEGEWSHSKFHK